ncbi:MAG: caspase family protein [Treponema sp.]|uniref:caspase family protein n=1 Tax=Treponema sp. TaxID=166 RepID=UPI0025D7C2E9|nr:caspase family protein [Treponema sp.]MBQ8680433.1 caspase family protein [Treponema sp.]
MFKKALIVGIDNYRHFKKLTGCVNDANNVNRVLSRDENGDKNFGTIVLTASKGVEISRNQLKDSIEELFSGNPDIALFYFAGHGSVNTSGGYLITSDCERDDEGVSLETILKYANESSAKNKIIIIDACQSGYCGKVGSFSETVISEGMTILTACKENQYASETPDATGLFTSLMIDALEGAASNLLGEITPGAVYAHIDKSLGDWEQRPVFKTNVDTFTVLRHVNPPIDKATLRKIIEYFPTSDYIYPLDPSYEPERTGGEPADFPKPDKANNKIFAILQKYNRLNLLVPVDAPHMWHAAINYKSCKLTSLGKFYHKLITKGLI